MLGLERETRGGEGEGEGEGEGRGGERRGERGAASGVARARARQTITIIIAIAVPSRLFLYRYSFRSLCWRLNRPDEDIVSGYGSALDAPPFLSHRPCTRQHQRRLSLVSYT